MQRSTISKFYASGLTLFKRVNGPAGHAELRTALVGALTPTVARRSKHRSPAPLPAHRGSGSTTIASRQATSCVDDIRLNPALTKRIRRNRICGFTGKLRIVHSPNIFRDIFRVDDDVVSRISKVLCAKRD